MDETVVKIKKDAKIKGCFMVITITPAAYQKWYAAGVILY